MEKKERNTRGWLPALGQSVLTRKVASETCSRWNLSSCLQLQLGPPRPQWTGIWRNAQTMGNVRALCFPARDPVARLSLDFEKVLGREEIEPMVNGPISKTVSRVCSLPSRPLPSGKIFFQRKITRLHVHESSFQLMLGFHPV